jgi:large subunit ribosomal protein LP0
MAEQDERKRPARKVSYFGKLSHLLMNYDTVLVVAADNVGSNQLQKIRILLRGNPQGFVLMGKNTMARNCIKKHMAQKPQLEKLLPYVVDNIGFVFTNADPKAVRDIVLSVRVPAAAKAGATAPVSVTIPPGPTGMDPGQTAFFQSLNIATKIVKGSIEILNPVALLHPGDKVTPSQVALLAKLNIKPFSYGLSVVTVYENGAVYGSELLDLTEADLLGKFFNGVNKLASVSLAVGYPTLASLPHSFAGAFKNMVALSLETEIRFEEAQKFHDFMANPGAFASAGGASGGASSSAAEAAPVAAAPESEEEDLDLGGLW